MLQLNFFLQPVTTLPCFGLLGWLNPLTAEAVKICLQASLRSTGWTGANIHMEQKVSRPKNIHCIHENLRNKSRLT